jgi:hypothetical protein
MKIDPYKHKERYEKWKTQFVRDVNGKIEIIGEIDCISKFNSDLIIEYIIDMEKGINVARVGSRSPIRLNNLKQRMVFMIKGMEKLYKRKKITHITEREVISFFNDMRNGKIARRDGEKYTSVRDYVCVFKAFWHWYMRREKRKEKTVEDITIYIDTHSVKESTFAYFTIDEMKRMAERCKYEYKILMWFLFDSGIRAPTELVNIRVSDLSKMENSDTYQLNINDEISKTFGRRIKLLLCSRFLERYIKEKGLRDDDYLFPIVPRVANQYLKRITKKVFGKVKTKGGKYMTDLTMYDFRHSSCCYWLPRYKSESALKYRFGWKKSDMIHYYSKLLGMKDTIEEQDLVIDSEAQTKLQRELEQEKKDRELLDDNFRALQNQVRELNERMKKPNEILNVLFNDEQFIRFLRAKLKSIHS